MFLTFGKLVVHCLSIEDIVGRRAFIVSIVGQLFVSLLGFLLGGVDDHLVQAAVKPKASQDDVRVDGSLIHTSSAGKVNKLSLFTCMEKIYSTCKPAQQLPASLELTGVRQEEEPLSLGVVGYNGLDRGGVGRPVP